MKRFLSLFAQTLLLASYVFGEDFKLPTISKDKKTRVVEQYLQDWAIRNYVGSDAVYFYAMRANATQTATTGTFVKVAYDLDLDDPDDLYDEQINNRFVAPTEGIYLFVGTVDISAAADGTTFYIKIVKNGNVGANGFEIGGTGFQKGATGETVHAAAAIFRLEAGDYVEVYFYNNAATDRTIGNNYATSFQGVRIR